MHHLHYIIGAIIILVGLRTIIKQESSISIQLWGNSSDIPSRGNNAYSTSEVTGFIAVLIGIAEVAIGVGMLWKGAAFFN